MTHIITLYDTLLQVAITRFGYPTPFPLSFTNDIYPILQRAIQLQWVSSRVATVHRTLHTVIPPPGSLAHRELIFDRLRDPATPPNLAAPGKMPAIWSDEFPFLPQGW